jgi:hypothetical protein
MDDVYDSTIALEQAGQTNEGQYTDHTEEQNDPAYFVQQDIVPTDVAIC